MDKLDKLFNKQIVLQTRLKNIPFNSLKHKQEYINLMILACLDELSEVLRETAWKNKKLIRGGWKSSQKLNEKEFQEELVDLWHFLINLTLASGMNSEELFSRFINKNKVNHKRQDEGY